MGDEKKTKGKVRPIKTLTATEAAELLGISTKTLYALATRGKIKHYRKDRHILIAREDLREMQAKAKKARTVKKQTTKNKKKPA